MDGRLPDAPRRTQFPCGSFIGNRIEDRRGLASPSRQASLLTGLAASERSRGWARRRGFRSRALGPSRIRDPRQPAAALEGLAGSIHAPIGASETCAVSWIPPAEPAFSLRVVPLAGSGCPVRRSAPAGVAVCLFARLSGVAPDRRTRPAPIDGVGKAICVNFGSRSGATTTSHVFQSARLPSPFEAVSCADSVAPARAGSGQQWEWAGCWWFEMCDWEMGCHLSVVGPTFHRSRTAHGGGRSGMALDAEGIPVGFSLGSPPPAARSGASGSARTVALRLPPGEDGC